MQEVSGIGKGEYGDGPLSKLRSASRRRSPGNGRTSEASRYRIGTKHSGHVSGWRSCWWVDSVAEHLESPDHPCGKNCSRAGFPMPNNSKVDCSGYFTVPALGARSIPTPLRAMLEGILLAVPRVDTRHLSLLN